MKLLPKSQTRAGRRKNERNRGTRVVHDEPSNDWKVADDIRKVKLRPGWNDVSYELEFEKTSGEIVRFVATRVAAFTDESRKRRLERKFPL
jgi:hypothetical protein